MDAVRVPEVECGVANVVLPGQIESGDRYLIRSNHDGVLIAAIDGIGHGEEAANAAKAAISVLEARVDEPIISLVQRCHDELRLTRGVVLSLAFIDVSRGMMTWLGIGNIQGVLLRAETGKEPAREMLLLRTA